MLEQFKAYIAGIILAVIVGLSLICWEQHSKISTLTTDNATLSAQVAAKSVELKTCSDSITKLGIDQKTQNDAAAADLIEAKKISKINYATSTSVLLAKPASSNDCIAAKTLMNTYIDQRNLK